MKLAILALLVLPVCAQAQVFKCVAADGSTSYATVPCPEGSGETTRIIEPVPPSGVPTMPALAPEGEEDAPSAHTDDSAAKTPSASGITVIEDSDDAHREQKREMMRQQAEQHKKDLYDEPLRRKENREKQAEVQRK